jgi:hypothetical protein
MPVARYPITLERGLPLMVKPIGLKKAMRRLNHIADAISRGSRASLAQEVHL